MKRKQTRRLTAGEACIRAVELEFVRTRPVLVADGKGQGGAEATEFEAMAT